MEKSYKRFHIINDWLKGNGVDSISTKLKWATGVKVILKKLEKVKMITQREWLRVFPALDNDKRFSIFIWLSEGQQSFSAIEERFNLTPGNTNFHLNKLMRANLIDNDYVTPAEKGDDYSYYFLTPKGKEVMAKLLE